MKWLGFEFYLLNVPISCKSSKFDFFNFKTAPFFCILSLQEGYRPFKPSFKHTLKPRKEIPFGSGGWFEVFGFFQFGNNVSFFF